MKKVFFSILFCFVVTIVFAQTTFNDVAVINPSSLPQLSGNIYQQNETTCLLYGHTASDIHCETSRESEVVSFAMHNLAVSKFGSWGNSDFTPLFIENKITITNNIEQNLLSALDVVKEQGICSYGYEHTVPFDENNATFDAAFNIVDYGKLQFANDTNLVKRAIDKGYPIIAYFQRCYDYNIANLEDYGDYARIWGESIATGIRASSSESYITAVIVGYTKMYVPSRNQDEECFLMYCPKERTTIEPGWGANIIYVPFCKVAENIFDYAIVPHSLSPYMKPTAIEGPDYLVCEKNYQISSLPSNASIVWRKESMYLNITAGQNTSIITVSPVLFASQDERAGIIVPSFPVQSPKLIVTITLNGATLELSKTLEVLNNVSPTVSVQGTSMMSMLLVGNTYTFQVTNADNFNENSIWWNITMPNGTTQNRFGRSIQLTPSSGGTLRLKVQNVDGCEPDNSASYSYSVISFMQMQYNNPASETLYIQIVEQNDGSRTVSSTPKYYEGEYTLELYDKNTTLVRKMTCNTPQVEMSVSDLAPDNYYLRLVVEGQVIEVEQIIID